MSTRSITRVIPRQKGISFQDGMINGNKCVVEMYRHYDGYPEGHGVELASFLMNKAVGDKGTGCLAAQIITYFKPLFGVGGIYLQCPNDDFGSTNLEYVYTVFPKDGEDTMLAIHEENEGEWRCSFVGTAGQLVDKFTN